MKASQICQDLHSPTQLLYQKLDKKGSTSARLHVLSPDSEVRVAVVSLTFEVGGRNDRNMQQLFLQQVLRPRAPTSVRLRVTRVVGR